MKDWKRTWKLLSRDLGSRETGHHWIVADYVGATMDR